MVVILKFLFLANVLTIVFVMSRSCDLVHTDIDFKIIGEGFHRTLRVASNFSSGSRFINCRISYLFQIPDGAFVDLEELNLHPLLSNHKISKQKVFQQWHHCFVASRFNTELPVGSPEIAQLQPILFHSEQILRKVFVFEDALAFPIHLRYQQPVSGAKSEEDLTTFVEFNPPRIFLRCEANETLLADHTCRRHVDKIPCECSSQNPKCAAISLNVPTVGAPLIAKVFVGNKDHFVLVSFCTLFSVILCICHLLANLMSSHKQKHE